MMYNECMVTQMSKEKKIALLISSVGIVSTLALSPHDSWRILPLLLSFMIWLYVVWQSDRFFWSAILLLLLLLPFNITYQLPESIFSFDPYAGLIVSNYLIPTVSILDIYLLLALVGVVLDFYGFLTRKFLGWLAILFGYFAIHLLIHPGWVTLISSARYLAVITIISMAFTFREKLFGELKNIYGRHVNRYLTILMLSMLFQIVVGYLQVDWGSTVGFEALGESSLLSGVLGVSFWSYNGRDMLRAYGTFPHPNMLAGYLILIAYLFTAYTLYRQKTKCDARRNYILYMLFYFSVAFGIGLTFSRSGIFALLLLTLLFVVHLLITRFNRSSWRNKLASISPLMLWERVSGIGLEDASIQDRAKLIGAAVLGIKQNWLFGVGSGNSVNIYDSIYLQTSRGFTLNQPVHNVFLLLLLEHGLIAGTLFILGLVYVWSVAFVSSAAKWFTVAMISGVLIVGSLDHYLLTLPQGLVIFMFINLIVVALMKSVAKGKSK